MQFRQSAIGHIPIDVNELGVDMLSASAHKFNVPKGIGFLYCKEGILQPFHNGGSQESGMRAGTENVPAIVGMAVALKKNIAEMDKNANNLFHLTEVFLSILKTANVPFILNGHETNRLPGNISLSIKGKTGEGLMHMLDLKGICVSTGSACDSHNQQVSHVIQAIGVPEEYCEETIRITFGKNNTEKEAKTISESLIKLLRLLLHFLAELLLLLGNRILSLGDLLFELRQLVSDRSCSHIITTILKF